VVKIGRAARVLCLVLAWGQAGDAASAVTGTFAGKRGIFDEGVEHWMTKAAADSTLERIKEAGFSVYVPCVWHGRGVSWPSRYAPWDPALGDQPGPGYDPLAYLIGKAHAMGLEVHPWFTLVLRQAELFPDLALPGKDSSGNGAFDVHNARFRHTIADLVAEVVERYPVDGVNLDYVRAVILCQTEPCAQEYRQRYGRDLVRDARLLRMSATVVPTLVEYQREAVTAMVKAISGRIRDRKPAILLSIDAAPDEFPVEQGQDGIGWANSGLIDVIFKMDYGPTINVSLMESIRARLTDPDRLTLLAGNYDMLDGTARPRDAAVLQDLVVRAQQRWPGTGIALYLFGMLSNEQMRSLKAGPFGR
jgi:uncharacterized lipoprotein YddW (UPF0748 family)